MSEKMIAYICPHCGMEFYTTELFEKHVENCAKMDA